jgi:large subunit ribosomal protein L55
MLITKSLNHCFRAAIARIPRPVYARQYPVKLINEDGSSITINYPEPIAIIQLPFDISKLDEVERKRRLLKRQIASKSDSKRVKDEIIDKSVKFDPKKYLIKMKQ